MSAEDTEMALDVATRIPLPMGRSKREMLLKGGLQIDESYMSREFATTARAFTPRIDKEPYITVRVITNGPTKFGVRNELSIDKPADVATVITNYFLHDVNMVHLQLYKNGRRFIVFELNMPGGNVREWRRSMGGIPTEQFQICTGIHFIFGVLDITPKFDDLIIKGVFMKVAEDELETALKKNILLPITDVITLYPNTVQGILMDTWTARVVWKSQHGMLELNKPLIYPGIGELTFERVPACKICLESTHLTTTNCPRLVIKGGLNYMMAKGEHKNSEHLA